MIDGYGFDTGVARVSPYFYPFKTVCQVCSVFILCIKGNIKRKPRVLFCTRIFVRLLTHCVSYIKKHSRNSSSKLNSCILKISKRFKIPLKEFIWPNTYPSNDFRPIREPAEGLLKSHLLSALMNQLIQWMDLSFVQRFQVFIKITKIV